MNVFGKNTKIKHNETKRNRRNKVTEKTKTTGGPYGTRYRVNVYSYCLVTFDRVPTASVTARSETLQYPVYTACSRLKCRPPLPPTPPPASNLAVLIPQLHNRTTSLYIINFHRDTRAVCVNTTLSFVYDFT